MSSYLFTSESVSEDHPDKLAHQVSDTILVAIGVAQPTSIMVETFGTSKVLNEVLTALVREHFDLRPKGIVKMLDLLRLIYTKTASYGHFGRDEPEFISEAIDKASALKALV
jgi:S-adenosylmethionine synthetase